MKNWKAKLEKRVNHSFDKAINEKGFLSLQSIVESQFKYHGKRENLLKLEKRKDRLTTNKKRKKVIILSPRINIVRYSKLRKKGCPQEKINNVIKIWHEQRG